MAETWVHNGFLQLEGEKMSKGLGNFVTIRELLATDKFGGKKWSGEVLRLAMLRSHYRQPIDWTIKGLEETQKTLERWSRRVQQEPRFDGRNAKPDPKFVEALADDLNVPEAVARIHELLNASHFADPLAPKAEQVGAFALDNPSSGISDEETVRANKASAIACLALLGIEISHDVALSTDKEALIEARVAARARKDWKESDRIRDELAAMGVVLKDGKDADGKPVTTWEIAR
jgi:cysteinyl-tRNA synthetase